MHATEGTIYFPKPRCLQQFQIALNYVKLNKGLKIYKKFSICCVHFSKEIIAFLSAIHLIHIGTKWIFRPLAQTWRQRSPYVQMNGVSEVTAVFENAGYCTEGPVL